MSSLDSALDVGALVEMGFSRERVEQAVNATNKAGIQAAIEWLFNHPVADPSSGHTLGGGKSETSAENDSTNSTLDGAPAGDSPAAGDSPVVAESHADDGSAADGSSTTVALSLVCEDCGKQIRSEADAQAHAARTGHQNFAESSEAVKPLTAEEKEEQKKRLQEKLESRRKERLEQEKQADKDREKSRRRAGQEMTQVKQEMEYQEMKRVAEERRKEKLEERRLKQKIKEQIAKDRADLKSNPQVVTEKSPTKPIAETVIEKPVVKKEYNECRIQFRLSNGSSMTATFKADDTLFTVHDYFEKNRSDQQNSPFSLSTTFPRKTFHDEHMLKTLKELQLVPSAVLIVASR